MCARFQAAQPTVVQARYLEIGIPDQHGRPAVAFEVPEHPVEIPLAHQEVPAEPSDKPSQRLLLGVAPVRAAHDRVGHAHNRRLFQWLLAP
jgi:hypothetical protein